MLSESVDVRQRAAAAPAVVRRRPRESCSFSARPMSDPKDFRVVLPGGEQAAGRARRVLTEHLGSALLPERLADLQLLVTEIVANSVRHGGVGEDGEIDLSVMVSERVVRVELRDTGIQADPRLRTPDLSGGGGFGMVLVQRMSERWGVDHEPQVVMWFELRRDLDGSGPAEFSTGAGAGAEPEPEASPGASAMSPRAVRPRSRGHDEPAARRRPLGGRLLAPRLA
jgi:anti-sigma regulatory factor (Ser/Thr protein kinase)